MERNRKHVGDSCHRNEAILQSFFFFLSWDCQMNLSAVTLMTKNVGTDLEYLLKSVFKIFEAKRGTWNEDSAAADCFLGLSRVLLEIVRGKESRKWTKE